MKPHFFTLGLLSMSLWANATTTTITQQRETYQKINQLLNISQSEQTRAIAQTLLPQLQGYALYADAEYQLLKTKKNLEFAEIEQYQQQNPTSNFINPLKKQWLQQAVEQQNWQGILAQATQLPQDQPSQCLLMQAKLEQEKNQTKSPALLSAEIEKLWLTGKSLPSQCDPLFQQQVFSTDLIRQRALLALEENNLGLITSLINYTQDENLKAWLNRLLDQLKNPQNLPQWVSQLDPQNPDDKRNLIARFPAYVKTLQENNLPDPIGLFQQISTWADQFQLSQTEKNQWQSLLLNRLFDSPVAAFAAFRDQHLTTLKDDKLSERRIRLAIHQKENIAPWLALLSTKSANKDEWQYWAAKIATPEKSRKMLSELSRQRGFYSMLASQELGIPYQPEMLQLQVEKDTQEAKVEARYHNTLQRITELRYFNEMYRANSEWRNLLQSVDFNDKLRLGQYAEQQGWFDLAVDATIQAKAWGYIRQRLPNAYQHWFELLLQEKQIQTTFAMAIARQESAWKPYVASSANARGLMQLLPSTAKLTAQKANLPYSNENQLYQPFNNIMLGTAHLQELYDKYGNNRILISAAYNAGARRVDQWLAKSNGSLTMAEFVASIPFFETRGYVQNVLAYDYYYQILQQKPQQLFSQEEYNRLY